MPSPFDAIQKIMVDTVKSVYAFPAAWTASDNSATWSGLVLFKNPTEKASIAGYMDYDPTRWEMEYLYGDMPGLKELVDLRGTPPETVDVDGNSYYVRAVDTLFDGKTLKATLSPIDA